VKKGKESPNLGRKNSRGERQSGGKRKFLTKVRRHFGGIGEGVMGKKRDLIDTEISQREGEEKGEKEDIRSLTPYLKTTQKTTVGKEDLFLTTP